MLLLLHSKLLELFVSAPNVPQCSLLISPWGPKFLCSLLLALVVNSFAELLCFKLFIFGSIQFQLGWGPSICISRSNIKLQPPPCRVFVHTRISPIV